MVDSPGVFVNLAHSMTGKKRNWLAALFILAFPFLIFLGFLIYELTGPRSAAGSPSRPTGLNDATNASPPVPAAGTNLIATP
jgi:hypothetical protein